MEQDLKFRKWVKDFTRSCYEASRRYCKEYEEHEKDKEKSHERQRHELTLEIGSYMLEASSLDFYCECQFCTEDVMSLEELKNLLFKTLTEEEKRKLTYYQKKEFGIPTNDEC